ncbi:unnamed protein product [Adineta ricciae]|uniref:G-protein coupled receptors family 1 profile domain-containing protein n=2 Tax=Adineta ricciae TaxID=249248 RepID=A0A813WD68_ADIRI|nr:unnamed protein product [Adineta ricciae]CAF1426504.1 unnamed protein product [Adineta ricciae]
MLHLNTNDSKIIDHCLFGFCLYSKEYFLNQYYTIRSNAFTLPFIGAIYYDLPSLQYVYMSILIVLILIGLLNNIVSLMTFLQDRIRYTISGTYLIMYSICSLILMLVLFTNIAVVVYYDEYFLRLWACHGYPYLSLTMVYTGILISTAIAIENVLVESFKSEKYRSRKSAICSMIGFLFVASISNLDKIFARYLIADRSGELYCVHERQLFKSWSTLLFCVYILLPCLVHVICILYVLSIKVKLNWIHKIVRYQHHLVPSLVMVLCLCLNGFYRYSSNFSLQTSSNYLIRFHFAFLLFIYIPQMLTFMTYVTTNDFYIKEFYQIWFYRRLCCCFYNRKRHVQEFEVIHKLWQRRTSLETIKTISNLDDTCNESEFYRK